MHVKKAFAQARNPIVFSYDWLGRLFAVEDTSEYPNEGPVLMYDPGGLEIFDTEASPIDFRNEALIDKTEAALAVQFFQEWRSTDSRELAHVHVAPAKTDPSGAPIRRPDGSIPYKNGGSQVTASNSRTSPDRMSFRIFRPLKSKSGPAARIIAGSASRSLTLCATKKTRSGTTPRLVRAGVHPAERRCFRVRCIGDRPFAHALRRPTLFKPRPFQAFSQLVPETPTDSLLTSR
jgi:hypothetical protein